MTKIKQNIRENKKKSTLDSIERTSRPKYKPKNKDKPRPKKVLFPYCQDDPII